MRRILIGFLRLCQYLIFVHVWPACVLIVLIRTPWKLRLSLIFAFLLAITFTMIISRFYSSSFRTSEAARRSIEYLAKTHNLIQHHVSSYVDQATLSELGTWDIRILVSQPKTLGTIRTECVAFPNLLTSVLIISDPPGEPNDVQTFFVYHELGHIQRWGWATVVSSEMPLFTLALAYLPPLFLSGHWLAWIVILACTYFDSLVIRIDTAEAVADHFAITRMTRILDRPGLKIVIKRVLHCLRRKLNGSSSEAERGWLKLRIKTFETAYLKGTESSKERQWLLPTSVDVRSLTIVLLRLPLNLAVFASVLYAPRAPSWIEVTVLAACVLVWLLFLKIFRDAAVYERKLLRQTLTLFSSRKVGAYDLAHQSVLTVELSDLLESAGRGEPFVDTSQGRTGTKKRIDFGRIIGTYLDPKTGVACHTTKGIIHYIKDGIEVLPARHSLETMTSEEAMLLLKLSIQRALLGCVPERLHSLACGLESMLILLRAHFTGVLVDNDIETIQHVSARVIADFPAGYEIKEHCVSLQSDDEADLQFWAYRKEPTTR